MLNNANLNLVLILAIVAVVSVPIAYALVESSIVINLLSGQTTDPFVIKNNVGTELYSLDSSGDIQLLESNEIRWADNPRKRINYSPTGFLFEIDFDESLQYRINNVLEYTMDRFQLDLEGNDLVGATIDGDLNTVLDISEDQMNVKVGTSGTVLTSSGVGLPPTYQAGGGGGEVFTWTGNHSANSNSLTNLEILEFERVSGLGGQRISNFFGDMRLDLDSAELFIFRMGDQTEFIMAGDGNGNAFVLSAENKILWNTHSHNITPTATSLIYDLGAQTDRHRFQTNDIDRFTINNVDAQVSVPFDFNSNAITEAVINCSLNTCTNFPSGTSTYTVMGSRFNIITPTNTVFNFPSGQSGDSGNETEMVMIMTTSGTIDRLFFKYGSNSLDIPTTVTIRKNFADTSLTLSNPASSSALQSNLASSFTFVAGDEISITMITGAGTGQGTKPYWSFEITS